MANIGPEKTNIILAQDPDHITLNLIKEEILGLDGADQKELKKWVDIVETLRQPDPVVMDRMRTPNEIVFEIPEPLDAVYIKGSAILKWDKLKYLQDLQQDERIEKDVKCLKYFVSYKWKTKYVSDPDGETLMLIKKHLMNLKQPERVKVWIDYCCLPQHRLIDGKIIERTADETASFKQGLSIINEIESECMFLHCWASEASDSGWCFYEILFRCFQMILFDSLGYNNEMQQINEGLLRSMGTVQYIYQQLAFRIASHCFRRGHIPDIRSFGFKFADDTDCDVLNQKINQQVQLLRKIYYFGLNDSRCFGDVHPVMLLELTRFTLSCVKELEDKDLLRE